MARPNILWIYCDELRTDALGCYGNPYVAMDTPAIDAIAAGGVVFDQCFVNSPVCVPSRTSLLTGLLPERTGVYGNEAVSRRFSMTRRTTFPEVLAGAGYKTASFGKEHIPGALRPWQYDNPDGSGMQDIQQSVEDVSTLDLISSPSGGIVGGRYPPTQPYPPGAIVDNLLSWVTEARQPFLVRASFLQPHSPVIPPAAYAGWYERAVFSHAPRSTAGLSKFEQHFGAMSWGDGLSPDDFASAVACYYGMVAWIDREVGRLLDQLHARALDDNLVIVVTSDHGRTLGEFGAFGKHTFSPSVHRVPLIISWPGTLPAERRDDLVQGLDLARTMCALGGQTSPTEFEGRDLFADGAPEQVFSTIGFGERESYAYPNLRLGRSPDGRGWPRRTCVRTSRYRLDRTVRIDGGPAEPGDWDVFLADTTEDPAEVANVADDPRYRSIRDTLLTAIERCTSGSIEGSQDRLYEADSWPRRLRRYLRGRG